MTLLELPPGNTVPGPNGINRIVRRFSAPVTSAPAAAEPAPETPLRLADWLFGRNPDKPAAAARKPNEGTKGGVAPVAAVRAAEAIPGITPEQLRQERARSGLSQRAAARLCKLSRGSYADYESGRRHNPQTAAGIYIALARQPSGAATPVRSPVPPVRPLSVDPGTRQTCRVCRVDQPLTAFGRSRSHLTGYRTECQPCTHARLALGVRVCAQCFGPIPKRRAGDCCSRACLLMSVGLPVDFNPAWLVAGTGNRMATTGLCVSPAVEAEIRATLDAVMASARARQ